MILFRSDPAKNPKVSSPFGPRKHPKSGASDFHNGLDFTTPISTPCYAVADGRVVKSTVNNGGVKAGYGYFIVIEHDGFCTLYAHLNKLGLKVGTKVKAGQIIAYTGNTGVSTGPHLHFELRKGKFDASFFTRIDGKNPNSIDPEPYLSINRPEYINILIESGADASYWINGIRKNDLKIIKWIPELLLKMKKNLNR